MHPHPLRFLPLLLACSAVAGCSSGGEDDRPTSAVTLAADHHLFGIVGAPRFAGFPTTTNDLTTVQGRLTMKTDATYVLTDTGGATLASNRYSIDDDGAFALQLRSNGQDIVYLGGYGLVQDNGDLFMTDRFGVGIGLYVGARVVTGAADMSKLVGNWHLFMLEALMPGGTPTPDDDKVGRSFGGVIALAADGSLDGSGTASTGGAMNVRGNAGDFEAFADGGAVLRARFSAQGADDGNYRFNCGGNPRVMFGVDPDNGGTDTAAGLIGMIRFRDTSTAYSPTSLAGKYHFGLWTIFPSPNASGVQSAIGELELTTAGGFSITARDAGIPGVRDPADFDYVGTFVATDNGSLNFTVTDTGETWLGAFDSDYQTIVIADPVMRSASNLVELNFGVGIRPKSVAGR